MGTPHPAPINVFIDSDGPVANFDKALLASGADTEDFKLWPGTYLWLEPTDGALEALITLQRLDAIDKLRVWIATKTPSGSPYAYTEKVLWYRRHFPWLEDRVIFTHDKSLLGTENDFLLDDRPHKANVKLFRGTFMFFDVNNPVESWFNFIVKVQEAADNTSLTHA